MIRTDGKFTFYIIEFQHKGKGEWHFSGDCAQWAKDIPQGEYWLPRKKGQQYPDLNPCFQGFSASGRCWQETGVHGTYDERRAIEACQIVAKYNPEHNFRVSKITIQQQGEVIANFSYRMQTRNKK